MPLISRTFDQLIDFTRTSAATYTNSAGLVTLTPPSVNLLTFTQEFDNAAWSKNGTTVIPNQNPTAASLGPELGAAAAINIRPATGGTVTRSGGIITFTSPASGLSTAVSQEVTGLTIGRMYRFNGRMRRTAGANAASPQIRDASGGGGNGLLVGPGVTTDWVTFSLYWVANVTTAYFSFASGGASQTIEISEAEYSVREVIGGFITAPDGTLTGDLLAETTANAGHTISAGATLTTTPYVLSVYLKKGTGTTAPNWVQLYTGGTSTQYANFNLATGTVGNVAAVSTATITAVGNGWYRCALVFTPLAAGAAALAIAFTNNTDTTTRGPSYTGAATSDVFIWGAQLEAIPATSLTLGPVINNNGISLAGGATDNGNGTYTMPSLGSARFAFPLASLVNGATYQISIPVISTTGSYVSDWCDENSVSSAQVGTLVYYSGRAIYDSTFRFVDITSASGATTIIGAVTIQQVTGITGMPSAYAKNVGGLFPARFDYDPITLAPRGFLTEDQRTNLALYSEQFDNAAWTKNNATVAANSAVSPSGTSTADLVVSAVGTAITGANSSAVTFVAGSHTQSVYIKAATNIRYIQLLWTSGGVSADYANFDLQTGTVTAGTYASASMTNVGNGWYRIAMTSTLGAATGGMWPIAVPAASSARATTYVGNGTDSFLIWGAQLEAGAFATSYIPTVASTVTRASDTANITVANFSSWYNQPTGTFVIDSSSVAASSLILRQAFAVSDGTANNFARVYSYDSRWGGSVTTGGVQQADLFMAAGTYVQNVPAKFALALQNNNFAGVLNGGAPVTDVSGTMPVVDRMSLGRFDASGQMFVGHIRSIRYYPARLNNAQLQTLTA